MRRSYNRPSLIRTMAPRERRRTARAGKASWPRRRAPRRCQWSACTRRKPSWSTSFSARTPTSARWRRSLRWDPRQNVTWHKRLSLQCSHRNPSDYLQQMWVFDEEIGMNTREITFVPGLYKIFDEILGKLTPRYASQFPTSQRRASSGVSLISAAMHR